MQYSFFSREFQINCRGNLLPLSEPVVMGILNLTPDSFYDGGKFIEEKKMIKHVKRMLDEGASIIDVGAISSRPGSKPLNVKTEMNRLIPSLKILKQEFPKTIFSVDTFRSRVAVKALEAGASMINDITGGSGDKNMYSVIGELKVPYILMHMKGVPATMQRNPQYKNILRELLVFFQNRITKLRKAGVLDIIIDPGFGFGKTVEHNYELLRHLHLFRMLECPVLVGISRKSMINKVLGIVPDESLNGTTVLNTIALMKGASILRVHDVKEAMEAIILFGKIKK